MKLRRRRGAPADNKKNDTSSSFLGKIIKCPQHHHVFLLVIGAVIIALEIAFFYRRLVPLKVDLGDWSPTTSQLEKAEDKRPQNGETISGASPLPPPLPDGIFNGYPIYYQSSPTTTQILSQFHCIGETNAQPFHWKRKHQFIDLNWATRSCQFDFLCMDLDTHEFVLRLPEPHGDTDSTTTDAAIVPSHWESQQTVFTNQSAQGHPFGVSIGGINTKWTHAAFPRLRWFPRIDYVPVKDNQQGDASPSSSFNFYALPANVTLIPFHSLAAFNPGHLVWDDFLPIYTLLQIFDQHGDTTDPLLIRYILPGEGLWAGCDWKPDKRVDCEIMLKKFGSLMVRKPEALPFTTQRNWNATFFHSGDNNSSSSGSSVGNTRKSNLVCARHGLAGLGALTDHGVAKGHGWEGQDYDSMYNQGRGGQLWRFRNFLLSHLHVPISTEPPKGPPYRIIFSEFSSKMGARSMSFGTFVEALKAQAADGGLDDVELLRVRMKDYSLQEQAEMVSQAAMYVTGCGGGAVTATFLPRGASVLIFYSERGGVENNRASGKPARLDWDYFNNMAYAHVSWLPQPHGGGVSQDEIKLWVDLVRHEIERIRIQRAAYDGNDVADRT